MTPALQASLAFTIGYQVQGLGQEGGYVVDQGGPTYRGVTLAMYRSWAKNYRLTATDLQNMSEDQIVAFYTDEYWTPVCGDELPPGIALSVFDMAVNAGPGHAAAQLQTAIGGIACDGDIGPVTLAALYNELQEFAPADFVSQLATIQLAYYKGLSSWSVDGKGWTNRVNARKAAALALC